MAHQQCAPRRVYVDLGVNWCNTLRLHEDVVPILNAKVLPSNEHWYVFGFEASPLIAPFADQFVAWLNGERDERPESCLPSSGSKLHLKEYAKGYGCDPERNDWLMCVFKLLDKPLMALAPDPKLNMSALLKDRLASAKSKVNLH